MWKLAEHPSLKKKFLQTIRCCRINLRFDKRETKYVYNLRDKSDSDNEEEGDQGDNKQKIDEHLDYISEEDDDFDDNNDMKEHDENEYVNDNVHG